MRPRSTPSTAMRQVIADGEGNHTSNTTVRPDVVSSTLSVDRAGAERREAAELELDGHRVA